MMLTKEKCENALGNILCNIGVARSDYRTSGKAKEDYHTLKSLIEEHFSNQPLKFEELKEGMWVWDSQLKWFFRISICNVKIENFEYIKLFKVEKYEGGSMLMFYEPNRFYRKQVKE